MNLAKRIATESDIEFARLAHHTAYHDVVERQFGAWVQEAQDRLWAQAWIVGGYEIVICGGTPCGYVSIVDLTDQIYVRELVLLPEFQSRGIGTALLNEVMERARNKSIPVRLRTLHQNRAADLYRRLGFQEVGRTETHILFEWNSQ